MRLGLAVLAVAVLAAGIASAQQVSVGAGSSLSLSNASLDLGCSDLVISGTANLDTAAVSQAVDVSIPDAGTLNGGSASLEVTGNWSRNGTFNAGTGSVNFGDGCGTTSSTISNASTFYDLDLSTSGGKQVLFEAGATTTVDGMFSVSGAFENLLQIRSTTGGSEAFLVLAQVEMGSFVDVKDNHALPESVVIDAGSLISGNATGWYFLTVPALPLFALALLAAALYATGRRSLRRRARTAS